MNGREQMKAARAKALGRERHPARETHDGQSNKYALEPTLISMGVGRHRAFWARYGIDPLWQRMSMSGIDLKLDILVLTGDARNKGPLPLP
jgi:hypothetical protein